jgi:small subunit ribosomal protein S20
LKEQSDSAMGYEIQKIKNMANHKSSLKRIRQTETRNRRNRYYSKTMRNAVRNIRNITDKAEAAEAYKKVSGMLDKLATKRVISKNKSANLKSKLAIYVNKLGVA